MKTYYEILEIAVNATHNDIRNAYKKKSRECHPDKHSPDEVKLWTERFKEVDSAYKTLIDEELRKKYDQQIYKNFYNTSQTTTNRKSDVKNFTNQTTNKLNNLISEIFNLLNSIKNFEIKENNLEYLKQLKKDIDQKMESFNSLFKRLDWVVVNCSSKCQEEVYFLKKIVSEVKLRDKIEDAYLFLFFQELKFNLVQDNELLEMINNNHDLLATKKWKFNNISFDFLKSMSKYNAAKKDIKDFKNFEFTNLLKKIDDLFKIKTNLIDKINKTLLELTAQENLLKEEQLMQESEDENVNDIPDIKSNQSESNNLNNESQINDDLKTYELQLKEKEKDVTNNISVLKTNNIIIEREIKNLEKKKINPLLNFLFSFFSFNYYNKNKEINENINIKNNEIEKNLLKISKLEYELKEITEELEPPIDMDEYMNNLEKDKINSMNLPNQRSTSRTNPNFSNI